MHFDPRVPDRKVGLFRVLHGVLTGILAFFLSFLPFSCRLGFCGLTEPPAPTVFPPPRIFRLFPPDFVASACLHLVPPCLLYPRPLPLPAPSCPFLHFPPCFRHAPAHSRAFPRLQPVPAIPACPRLPGFCSRAVQSCSPRISAHSRGFSPCQLSPPAPAFPVFAALLSSPAVQSCSPRIPAHSRGLHLLQPSLARPHVSFVRPSSSPPPRKRFRFSPPHPSMKPDSLLRSVKNRLRYRNRLLIRKELLPLR